MVSPTVAVQRLASTAGGMRRILKHKGPVVKYIQKAVETGVYRSQEELQACARARSNADDLAAVMRRFRQDIVRGSSVQDYPAEYLILKQHPPVPDPPRTPVKLLRKLRQQQQEHHEEEHHPMDALVRKYMNRYEQKDQDGNILKTTTTRKKQTMSSDEYYRRLLGVQASKSTSTTAASSVLMHKSASIQQAYQAAVYHYQLQRQSDTKLSDKECMKQVDEILASQRDEEEVFSRQRRKEAQEKFENQKQQNDKKAAATSSGKSPSGDDTVESSAADSSTFSVFKNNPRTVKAMMIWSERLAAVPYKEWTIGASTSLDHWIARQILGLSEETWQACLEGSSPDLLAIGRDIVATREALFPETNLDYAIDEDKEAATLRAEAAAIEEKETSEEDEETKDGKASEKSIEELLASLGGLQAPDDGDSKATTDSAAWDWLEGDATTKQDAETDAAIDKLVCELQDWRRRHHEDSPYDKWSADTKQEFQTWLEEYVDTVLLAGGSPHSGSKDVDYESTREALLSQPPLPSREESDAFWGSLTEPQLAKELLQRMSQGDTVPTLALDMETVWKGLDESEQLDRLLNLGALRPLLDEYARDSDRTAFLQRHGPQLLEGVSLEHLVSDPDGPISVSDLPEDVASTLNLGPNDRFSLQVKSYNAIADGNDVVMSAEEKSRLLYMAWNQHKAARARYEETLFNTGRMGLRYSDPLQTNDNDEED